MSRASALTGPTAASACPMRSPYACVASNVHHDGECVGRGVARTRTSCGGGWAQRQSRSTGSGGRRESARRAGVSPLPSGHQDESVRLSFAASSHSLLPAARTALTG